MSVVVENLSKQFGEQRAVDNIRFSAQNGEVVGFLGPNGAGKSTTMKIITCFIPPTSGIVKVCDKNVMDEPMEVRKKIGYLPESNPLYYDMYVKEYLEFIANIHRLGTKTKARVDEMIETTGLTLERNKIVGTLSKGYKQRVGLAQAMLHDPEVLILDEPTSGLDPNQLIEIRELIRRLGKNKTVIFSSHIMQEVQAVADRVVIINRGKIVADDSTANLQARLNNEMIVTVQFKQKLDKSALGEIKGIKSYEEMNDGKWHIVSSGNIDVRENIFHFAKDKNLTLLELHKDDFSLEDVFKQVTKAN